MTTFIDKSVTRAVRAIVASTGTAPAPFQVRSRRIDWRDVASWKDPNYVVPDSGAAYRIIRQILSERPRPFQEIIGAGLEIHAKELEASSPGSEEAKVARESVVDFWKGFKKGVAKDDAVCKIPKGHPFMSSNWLRRRLGILQSQDLVRTHATRPATGTVRNEELTPEERNATGSAFSYFLSTPTALHGVRKTDPLASWNTSAHWDRLCRNEFGGHVFSDLKRAKEEQARVERERRLASGKERRDEDEIWTWEGRIPEFTTKKQRDHLANGNRSKLGRDRMEMKLYKKREKYDFKKKLAKKVLEQEAKTAKTASTAQQDGGASNA